MQCLVPGEVGHERSEVLKPGVVLIPVERIDHPLKRIRCIEWIPPFHVSVNEGVDVDPNPQPVFDGGEVADLDWVLDLMQVIGLEETIILVRSLWVVVDIGACRGDDIPKTSIVGVSNVDYRLILGEEGRQLLVFPHDQWQDLAHLEAEG